MTNGELIDALSALDRALPVFCREEAWLVPVEQPEVHRVGNKYGSDITLADHEAQSGEFHAIVL